MGRFDFLLAYEPTSFLVQVVLVDSLQPVFISLALLKVLALPARLWDGSRVTVSEPSPGISLP